MSTDKLYYSPKSCGAASYIASVIAGGSIEAIEVDLKSHTLAKSGDDFYKVNSKGNVPFLLTSKGSLAEGPAVMQYIADSAPQSKLAPANGTFERYQLQDSFNFVSTDLHATISPLFAGGWDDAAKKKISDRFRAKLQYLNKGRISEDAAFSTQQVTIAGIYLFIVLSW